MKTNMFGDWVVTDANDSICQIIADVDAPVVTITEDPDEGMFFFEVRDSNDDTIVSSESIFRNRGDALIYLRKFFPKEAIQ